ncbi:MAG TPA: hypothetical protein VMU36_08025 [Spirochaetia bacterium]|nr:hypothetical protein [Spirochaetia bacterium]
MVRFFTGLVLLLALVCGAILIEGGDLLGYVGFTAFMIVFFPAVVASLAVWKARDLGQAFRDALGEHGGDHSAGRSVRIWAFYERVFYLSGVLGWLTGVVLILGTRASDTPLLGRPFSASLTAVIYGVFFGIVARILRYRAERGVA